MLLVNPRLANRAGAEFCAHCALPVRGGARFCCAGCEVVYGLLHAQHLDRFYDLGGGRHQPVGAPPKARTHDWLPGLEGAQDLVTLTLDVQGIRCAACVWLLQELWRRRAGALAFDLNPALGQVRLAYDRRKLQLGEYLGAIEGLGYQMGPASKKPDERERALLLRFGVCIALALNAMMFATAIYTGMTPADGAVYRLFSGLQFGLATLAVLIGGPVFFRAALAGIRHRVLHLDLPISLGIALAYGASAWRYFAKGDPGYLDTVTVFVALMLLGRYLQQRAVRRNRDFLLQNDGAEHVRARVLAGDRLDLVPISAVRAGDQLLLAPGDLVPVRGTLVQAGSFSFDWLSGESEPRALPAGAVVPAGAFSAGSSPVRIVAQADARESGLLQLLATPPGNPEDLRGVTGIWPRLNRSYVACVLALAALAGAIWLVVDPARAPEVVTALLVVTCPCALGIATPLAFELALARLRRAGIFVRSQALLHKALAVRKVIFDKTGTLTWGGLAAEVLREPTGAERDVLLTMAAASNHPVSKALVAALGRGGFRYLPDLDVTEHPGQGLEGRLGAHTYRLGVQRFVLGTQEDERRGLCLFACDGHVRGCFALEEDFRPGARDEIRGLAARGLEVWLLSGDKEHKVARARELLDIPPERARAGLSAEDKARLIGAIDQHDTMMIGDGINDAPAFSAAFCCGTPALDRPVMPSRADFCFTGPGSGSVARLLATAAHFARVVRTNLRLSLAYNLSVVTLACLGLMTPLLCAVLMPLSSLALTTHTSLRLQ